VRDQCRERSAQAVPGDDNLAARRNALPEQLLQFGPDDAAGDLVAFSRAGRFQMRIEVRNPVGQRERIGAGERDDHGLRVAGDEAMGACDRQHGLGFLDEHAALDQREPERLQNFPDFFGLVGFVSKLRHPRHRPGVADLKFRPAGKLFERVRIIKFGRKFGEEAHVTAPSLPTCRTCIWAILHLQQRRPMGVCCVIA
jgi:hypothetical protein